MSKQPSRRRMPTFCYISNYTYGKDSLNLYDYTYVFCLFPGQDVRWPQMNQSNRNSYLGMNEVMDSNYTKCCSLRFRTIMLLLHKESAGLQKPKHATGAAFCITSSSIVHILNPKGLPHIIFFVLRILTRRPLILKKSILQLLDDCTIKYRWIASLVMPSVPYKKPSSAMRCTEMYDMLTHNESYSEYQVINKHHY